MKRILLVAVGLGALIGLAIHFNRSRTPAESLPPIAVETTPAQTVERAPALPVVPTKPPRLQPTPTGTNSRVHASPALSPRSEVRLVLKQAVDTLVSPKASYEEKQAVWKQLRAAGNLDPAIYELE